MYLRLGLLAIPFIYAACSSKKEDDPKGRVLPKISEPVTPLDLSYLENTLDLKEKELELKNMAMLAGSTAFLEKEDIEQARQNRHLETLNIPSQFQSNQQIMDWARENFIMGILAREMGDFLKTQENYGGDIVMEWIENSVSSNLAQIEESAKKINAYVQTEAYQGISSPVDQQATLRALIILLDAEYLSSRLSLEGKQVSSSFDKELSTAIDSFLNGKLTVHIDPSSPANKFDKDESGETLGRLIFIYPQTSPDIVVHEALHAARDQLGTTEPTLLPEERYAHGAMAVYYYESRGKEKAFDYAIRAQEGIVNKTAIAKKASIEAMAKMLPHKSEWLPIHYIVYLSNYALVESIKLKDQADPQHGFTQSHWIALAHYADEYSKGQKANEYLDRFEKGLIRYEWFDPISKELDAVKLEIQNSTNGIAPENTELIVHRYLHDKILEVEAKMNTLQQSKTRDDQWRVQLLSIRLLALQAYQEALNQNAERAQAKIDQIMSVPDQLGLPRDFEGI